jgi:hypothetical protein
MIVGIQEFGLTISHQSCEYIRTRSEETTILSRTRKEEQSRSRELVHDNGRIRKCSDNVSQCVKWMMDVEQHSQFSQSTHDHRDVKKGPVPTGRLPRPEAFTSWYHRRQCLSARPAYSEDVPGEWSVKHPKLGGLRWWFSNPTELRRLVIIPQQWMCSRRSWDLLIVAFSCLSPHLDFGELTELLHLEGSTLRVGLYRKFVEKRHLFERMLVHLNSRNQFCQCKANIPSILQTPSSSYRQNQI